MVVLQKTLGKAEKRKKQRVECLEKVEFVVDGKTYMGVMESMGVGGFFVRTNKSFAVGKNVNISFYARSKNGDVNFSGEITRTNVKGFAVKI